jgi:threonine synthase
MDSVRDEEMVSAIKLLAQTTGIFGEPSGVAGLAGLLDSVRSGQIDKSESAVVIMTGNGLKDIDPILETHPSIISIPPELSELKKAMKRT